MGEEPRPGPGRPRYWAVRFGPAELGVLDEHLRRLLRPRERRHLGL